MIRTLSILCLFLTVSLSARQSDSARMAALGERLAEYYQTLRHESLSVQKQECDFLIESTADSLLKQFVALDIYDHFRNSEVMGSENVAVHVFDRWFASGDIRMKNDTDFVEARTFADFNRRSLIGENAPSLQMKTMDSAPFELFGERDSSGRFRILYFYDTDCSKCRLESASIDALLRRSPYPVDFYAVYVGDDHASWKEYADRHLAVDGAVHLWDPSLDSDFQRKYGVTKTPRLFLIAPDGTILGRNLDSEALKTLLDGIFAERELKYGGPESEALYDGIFSASSGKPSVGEVKGIADYIADRTLGRGDTLMFRQMAGDYLYYLSAHPSEGSKEGLRYHIGKNILSSDVWKSADDTMKVVGFAQIMSDLLAKAAPGTEVPDIRVPGELYTWRGEKNVCMRLGKLKKDFNIIIFYAEGCEVCAEEKSAARALLRGNSCFQDAHRAASSVRQSLQPDPRDINVFMVNVDRIMTEDPSLATRLMDSFDLSSLPYILITDAGGIVLRRYVSLLS